MSVQQHGREAKIVTKGPGTILGEIGLLAFSLDGERKTAEEIDRALKSKLEQAGDDLTTVLPPGVRSATCSALNNWSWRNYPAPIFLRCCASLVWYAAELSSNPLARLYSSTVGYRVLRKYAAQGLYEGQSILVLDLDNCTRVRRMHASMCAGTRNRDTWDSDSSFCFALVNDWIDFLSQPPVVPAPIRIA